jgi:hypothetical protein
VSEHRRYPKHPAWQKPARRVTQSATVHLKLGKIFSRRSALIVGPAAADLSGFLSIDELLRRLEGRAPPPRFAFEKEFALYLLFVASIWPDNRQRLVDAARLFGGTINYVAAKNNTRISKLAQKSFNTRLFSKVGGVESLLFCPAINDFHQDVHNRLNELAPLHDVVDLIFRLTVIAPELTQLKFAFYAISRNALGRENDYGISSGPKRKRVTAISMETLHAKWRRRPKSLILSYLLVEHFKLGLLPPGHWRFLHLFSQTVQSGHTIRSFQAAIERVLSRSKAARRSGLAELLEARDPPRVQRIHVQPPTDVQLSKILEAASAYFSPPMRDERIESIRQSAKKWYL